MKKIMLLLLSVILLHSGLAVADLQLESPDRLLKRAGTGRIQLREVILDITKNIPEMRDPRTFDSYFDILDALDALATQHRLDEIYPGAVKALAEKMVVNGIRWLKIEEDSSERVLNYHRWMSADIAESYQGEIERVMADEKDPAKLRTLVINTEAVAKWAETRFPENTRLITNYWRILSDVAARFIKRADLSDEELAFWISKVSHPEPLAMVMENLQKEIFSLTEGNRAVSHRILSRLALVKSRIDIGGSRMPFHVHSMLGEIAVELILRMTKLEEPFKEGEFSQALGLLENRYLQGLGALWVARSKIPSGAYARSYFDSSRMLAEALYDAGFFQESLLLNGFISRVAAPVMGKMLDVEGTYELKGKDGKKWTFSVALVREDQYFAALTDGQEFVYKPFTYVEYDFNTEEFMASGREKDSDPEPIWPLRFKISGNQIEIFDPWGEPTNYPLIGKKTESYPDFFAQSSEDVVSNPEGRYKGVIEFAKGSPREVTLIVTKFNGYTLGRLTDKSGHIQLDLNVGSRGTDGVLYLTTGIKRATWTQLRGVFKDGAYRGVAVIGGREMTKGFVLKKVTE